MGKICDNCQKDFGFLEKVYKTDDGKQLCITCAQEVKQLSQASGAVELKDTSPQQSNPSQTNEGYVQLKPEKESSKWEFKVVKLSVGENEVRKGTVTIERFETTINQMGTDGWELVAVVPLNVMLMQREGLPQPAMIFKRKKRKDASML